MTIYHSIAILLPWAAWLAYWMKASSWAKQTVKREDRLSRTLQSIPLIVGCLLIVWPDASASWNSANAGFDLRQWLGLAVVVAGLSFSVWGRRHLGSNWSVSVTLKDGHELVRSGPYALVRHPIYSGCLLAIAGSALVCAEPRGVIGFALIFASLAYKVRVEERWLSEYFGDPYRTYRREVRALVPWLY
ncbi:isoprenylcysteine carboxyl methyltransferase [Caballeronia mineralivorans PML1(12)]|uniref:Isoprenylcysteine carboxyl methyltransferase n=1 Tax=Caballeronia mineralivorans PML1(12) TaxID=908627 RepID=A0A0J1CW75_9BURK|nr:isoprenylcysteine carboxylmethyltransferase family protein [Caballeronia mineralivorans]KLU24581.1 isoprenylcysteine carboxyl methyltransferase [Caballeronia mineralivorans PML1(12)]